MLLIAARDHVSGVKINIKENGSFIQKELTRHINPNRTEGCLKEPTVVIDPTADTSCLSVLLDYVKVRPNSVVMGAVVYDGNQVIDNSAAYNGDRFWAELK